MKIVMSVPNSIAGGPPAVRVLGDDAVRDFIRGWAPDVAALIQTGRYPRANQVRKFARKNIETAFAFTTERVHATYAAALNFVGHELVEVPNLIGTVTVSQLGTSSSALRIEAVISRVRLVGEIKGVTSIIEYTVEGGAFTFTSTT